MTGFNMSEKVTTTASIALGRYSTAVFIDENPNRETDLLKENLNYKGGVIDANLAGFTEEELVEYIDFFAGLTAPDSKELEKWSNLNRARDLLELRSNRKVLSNSL